jgi:CheY-like chemotaxis protein
MNTKIFYLTSFLWTQMPLMNGYEATKEIRKLKSCYNSNNRNNGRDRSRNKRKCIAAGMNDYIKTNNKEGNRRCFS